MSNPNCPFIVKNEFQFIRLVDNNNKFNQKIHIQDAKKLAYNVGLDLVCFNMPENDGLALCKLVNFGKWKYNNEKAKKKQQLDNKKETKEIRFSPTIADNDVEYRIKQAKEFLKEGNDVIFNMKMYGREKIYYREAEVKLEGIIGLCSDCGKEISRNKTHDSISIRVTKIKVDTEKL